MDSIRHVLVCLLLLQAFAVCVACPTGNDDDVSNDDDAVADDDDAVADDDDAAKEPYFVDVSSQAGITDGPPGGGCGVAVGDADGDGTPDLYLTQIQTRGLLYLNDGNGGFNEQASQSGLFREGNQNFGASFIDIDGDGDQDLIRANAGVNQVLINEGGYFTLSAAALGFGGDRASVSTAFADMDGDGDLDLYLTNGSLDYGPKVIADEDQLFRNDDGVFVDISEVLPPAARRGFGFVSGWTDTDHDGDMDIYVVNDFGFVVSNQLFVNEGPGTGGEAWEFSVATDTCGCAITEAGMGLAIGDVDRDGWQDFYLSNGAREEQGSIVGEILLRNAGGNSFIDVSLASGAVAASIPDRQSSWGLEWLDVDNDGWLDAIIPYGDFEDGEPDTLMMNNGDGTLRRVQSSFSGLEGMGWGMGMGVVDYDADGCLDVMIANRWGTGPRLYRNRCTSDNHWLQVELRAPSPNTEAIGAVVVATVDGLPPLREEVVGGSTSAHSSRWKTLHFGLGQATSAALDITWPDGSTQSLDVDGDQRVVVDKP